MELLLKTPRPAKKGALPHVPAIRSRKKRKRERERERERGGGRERHTQEEGRGGGGKSGGRNEKRARAKRTLFKAFTFLTEGAIPRGRYAVFIPGVAGVAECQCS